MHVAAHRAGRIDGKGGTDTTSIARNPTLAADLENLILNGTEDLDGTGNEAANRMDGNGG